VARSAEEAAPVPSNLFRLQRLVEDRVGEFRDAEVDLLLGDQPADVAPVATRFPVAA
jgi:hypothetical protein